MQAQGGSERACIASQAKYRRNAAAKSTVWKTQLVEPKLLRTHTFLVADAEADVDVDDVDDADDDGV